MGKMNKEDFGQWLNSAATQQVFDKIREYRYSYVDALSSGQTLFHEAGKTQVETARVLGILHGIDLILEIKYEGNEDA